MHCYKSSDTLLLQYVALFGAAGAPKSTRRPSTRLRAIAERKTKTARGSERPKAAAVGSCTEPSHWTSGSEDPQNFFGGVMGEVEVFLAPSFLLRWPPHSVLATTVVASCYY